MWTSLLIQTQIYT